MTALSYSNKAESLVRLLALTRSRVPLSLFSGLSAGLLKMLCTNCHEIFRLVGLHKQPIRFSHRCGFRSRNF